jgi:hypothetical protein
MAGTTPNAAQYINSTAVGSGTNGPATAQLGLSINHQKQNYLTTTQVGEIDGLYSYVRQGGPNSDAGGMLIDVASAGNGFTAILEGVSTLLNSSGVTQRAIRTQIGAHNPQSSDYFGLLLQADNGTSKTGLRIADTPGQGQWTNFIEGFLSGSANFIVTNAGNVFAAAGMVTGPGGVINVQGYTTATSAGGAWLMWNKNSGDGATWLLNQKGGGSGGFHVGQLDTAGNVTDQLVVDSNGLTTFSNGLTFATSPAPSSNTDLSRHIALYPGLVGFSVTSGRLNYVLPTGNAHTMMIGTTDIASFAGAAIALNAPTTLPSATISSALKLSGALSGIAPAVVGGTAYTVSATDYVLLLAGSGTLTLTLPAAASNAGRILILKNAVAFAVNSASANVFPFAGGAAGTAIMPVGPSKFCWLQCDGSSWQTMMAN